MKQHITVKQRDELSKKGKKRYEDLWIKKYLDRDYKLIKELFGDKKALEDPKTLKTYAEVEYMEKNPLLNIGQMIEFLDERWKFIGISKWANNKYSVTDTTHHNSRFRKELIDALWVTCKEIFER